MQRPSLSPKVHNRHNSIKIKAPKKMCIILISPYYLCNFAGSDRRIFRSGASPHCRWLVLVNIPVRFKHLHVKFRFITNNVFTYLLGFILRPLRLVISVSLIGVSETVVFTVDLSTSGTAESFKVSFVTNVSSASKEV